MGWSLLGACVEPTQEPGNSTLFWVLLGCGLGSRCVPARGPVGGSRGTPGNFKGGKMSSRRPWGRKSPFRLEI